MFVEPVSLRSVGDRKREFVGHAAVFNREAEIAGEFREQVERGAFARTIGIADVPFVRDHDASTVMARTSANNLQLSEDKTGLLVVAPELDERDDDVRQLLVKMQNGNVNGMSFAFRTIQDEWDDKPEDEGLPKRSLRELALYDVSAVTNPAYEGTDAAIRSEARSVLAARDESTEEDTTDPESGSAPQGNHPDHHSLGLLRMRLVIARTRAPELGVRLSQ